MSKPMSKSWEVRIHKTPLGYESYDIVETWEHPDFYTVTQPIAWRWGGLDGVITNRANATLMAAAPKLLAACKIAVCHMRDRDPDKPAVIAAITEAEGKPA
jgi:hypothetical protein